MAAKPKPIPLAELVVRLATEHDCLQSDAKRMLGSVQSVIHQPVIEGKTVRLPDLATFSVVDVLERQGRNPATGDMQTVPATRRVRIAVAGLLKAAVKADVPK